MSDMLATILYSVSMEKSRSFAKYAKEIAKKRLLFMKNKN